MKQVKKKTSGSHSSSRDAITLLTEDHKKVKKLFSEFKKLKNNEADNNDKADLVTAICNELTVHAQVEEEIFYPAVRAAIDEDDLMDEADEEHDGIKGLIEQLEVMEPEDDHYDAKVTVLGEYVDHHVKEEQEKIFPKVKKSDLDTLEIGMLIIQRKQELKADRPEIDVEEDSYTHA